MFQTACTSFLRNSLPSWVSASRGVATQVMQLKILVTQLVGFSEEDLSSLAKFSEEQVGEASERFLRRFK